MLMEKSRLRNKYLNWPSRENFLAFKKIKNKANNLIKRSKKQYFETISSEGKTSSKVFWNAVKPFMTNKGIRINDNITIEAEINEEIKIKGKDKDVSIKAKDLIKDEKILVEMFNNHYVNIVEKTSGIT